MEFDEQAMTIQCEGARLVGILARPREAVARGVLIVVGGPQYRAGSHRQFTLLARHLAARGFASLRFDYRGMGDSDGAPRSFEDIDGDIGAAVDELLRREPRLSEVVLWGLCDAASAAMFYAPGDSRVSGLVLVNPWVRTGEGRAKAYLRHYYLARLLDREFWRKLRRGEFGAGESARSLLRMVSEAFVDKSARRDMASQDQPLPERMRRQFERFNGRTLLILSGNDLTASEFRDAVAASRIWQRMLRSPEVAQRELSGANHTFSTRGWRDQVAHWTCDWLRSS